MFSPSKSKKAATENDVTVESNRSNDGNAMGNQSSNLGSPTHHLFTQAMSPPKSDSSEGGCDEMEIEVKHAAINRRGHSALCGSKDDSRKQRVCQTVMASHHEGNKAVHEAGDPTEDGVELLGPSSESVSLTTVDGHESTHLQLDGQVQVLFSPSESEVTSREEASFPLTQTGSASPQSSTTSHQIEIVDETPKRVRQGSCTPESTGPLSARLARFTNATTVQSSHFDPASLLTQAEAVEPSGDKHQSPQRNLSTPTSTRFLASPYPLLSTLRNSTPRVPRNIDDGGVYFQGQDSDDEESSDSDSDSDDSAEPMCISTQPTDISAEPASILKRRAANVRRNEERLEVLGLGNKKHSPDTQIVNSVAEDDQSLVSLKKRSRLIFSTKYNGASMPDNDTDHTADNAHTVAVTSGVDRLLDDIRQRYPGRDSQIFSLASLIQTALDQTVRHKDLDKVFVPPPIFVQGAAGTGKTSVVHEIVHAFTALHSRSERNDADPVVGSAYINCATISPASIGAIVGSAFEQIVRGFELPKSERRSKKKQRLKLRLGRKSKSSIMDHDFEAETFTADDLEEYDEQMDEEVEDRIEERRLEMSQAPEESRAQVSLLPIHESNDVYGAKTRKRTIEAKGPDVDGSKLPIAAGRTEIQNDMHTEATSRSHDAPITFGRSLRTLIGDSSLAPESKGNGCAILILDHAEKLMTLAPKRITTRAASNYLAQLLLLPKEMRLNLMVICISKSSLLHLSSVNNGMRKSVGSIECAIHPLQIRFPAYSNKQVFKEILTKSLCLEHMTDNEDNKETKTPDLGSSFLDTVIQSLLGTTRDVRAMIGMAQCLWPTYTAPVTADNIKRTMEIVSQRLKKQGQAGDERNPDILQNELLQYLDEKIMKHTALWIENCLGLMHDLGRPTADMPYLTKCLLLAGFICQHNKPEKDRQLFTNEKGKKKSKNSQRVGVRDAENAAFADSTWDQRRLKMLRPRCFPLERVLSVLLSIIGVVQAGDNLIHQKFDMDEADFGQIVRSMGSPVFFECLAYLRKMGLLREIPGNQVVGGEGKTPLHGINKSNPMYCCDLDYEDAEMLAQSIKFPLTDYLIK